MYYGVRCSVIHPGFTDTPMVRALGEEYIRTKVLPQTQLKRLIKPEEIADAICFYGNKRRRKWRTLGRCRVAPGHVTDGQEFNQTRITDTTNQGQPG
jgi:NAD(P)-dependent dehydrogenase (short-subunit alcohol dehydrogenase family)